MTTIRRIYAYLLAFAGLAMLSIALANLAQVLIDTVLQAPLARNEQYVRNTVSLNAAAALVGLPVWALHWLWMERSARSDSRERASTLRRLYLYGVQAGAMLFMASSAQVAVANATTALAGLPTEESGVGSVPRPLPFTLIGCVVWLVHWRVAARDRDLVGETGGSARLRRWYVYGLAFVGLLMLLVGTHGLVEALWRMATQWSTSAAAAGLPGAVASALVGLAVWLVHWVALPRGLPEIARDDDGVAVLRSVYLFLALSVGIVGALIGASQLLYYTVGRLLGVEHPGGVGGDLVQAAAGPGSAAIVYGSAWAYQRQAIRRQAAAFTEAPRQAGIRRLYTYVVALVALAVLAIGVAGLLWTLGDVLLSAPAATTGEGWRGQVALYATLALVGLPVWLVYWRPTPTGSPEEWRSLARRLYVYLVLIGAMLALIGSAAAALYRAIGLLLGEGSGVGVLTDLAHALAVAGVAVTVATYHWRILRRDAQRIQPAPAAPAEAQALVEIRAADAAALERAIAALRSTGVEVTLRT